MSFAVAVRARPLLYGEEPFVEGEPRYLELLDNRRSIRAQRNDHVSTTLNFDEVFDEWTTQDETFHSCVSPLIDLAFQGESASLVLFGPSRGGKRYTMYGNTLQCPGIQDTAVDAVMQRVERLNSSRTEDRVYFARASWFALAGEQASDLLHPISTPDASQGGSSFGRGKSGGERKATFSVREDNIGVGVRGVREIVLRNRDDMSVFTSSRKDIPNGCHTCLCVSIMCDRQKDATDTFAISGRWSEFGSQSDGTSLKSESQTSGTGPQGGNRGGVRRLTLNLSDKLTESVAPQGKKQRTRPKKESFSNTRCVGRLWMITLAAPEKGVRFSRHEVSTEESKRGGARGETTAATAAAGGWIDERGPGKAGREARHASSQWIEAMFSCVTALQKRSLRVPYHTSKITAILKDSLSLRGSSVWLACIALHRDRVSDIVDTLQFGSSLLRLNGGSSSSSERHRSPIKKSSELNLLGLSKTMASDENESLSNLFTDDYELLSPNRFVSARKGLDPAPSSAPLQQPSTTNVPKPDFEEIDNEENLTSGQRLTLLQSWDRMKGHNDVNCREDTREEVKKGMRSNGSVPLMGKNSAGVKFSDLVCVDRENVQSLGEALDIAIEAEEHVRSTLGRLSADYETVVEQRNALRAELDAISKALEKIPFQYAEFVRKNFRTNDIPKTDTGIQVELQKDDEFWGMRDVGKENLKLKKKISSLSSEIHDFKMYKNVIDVSVSRLQQQTADMVKERDAAKNSIHTTNLALKRERERNAALGNELRAIKKIQTTATKKFEGEVQKYQNENQTLRREQASLRSRVASLSRNLEETTKRLAIAGKSLVVCETEIQDTCVQASKTQNLKSSQARHTGDPENPAMRQRSALPGGENHPVAPQTIHYGRRHTEENDTSSQNNQWWQHDSHNHMSSLPHMYSPQGHEPNKPECRNEFQPPQQQHQHELQNLANNRREEPRVRHGPYSLQESQQRHFVVERNSHFSQNFEVSGDVYAESATTQRSGSTPGPNYHPEVIKKSFEDRGQVSSGGESDWTSETDDSPRARSFFSRKPVSKPTSSAPHVTAGRLYDHHGRISPHRELHRMPHVPPPPSRSPSPGHKRPKSESHPDDIVETSNSSKIEETTQRGTRFARSPSPQRIFSTDPELTSGDRRHPEVSTKPPHTHRSHSPGTTVPSAGAPADGMSEYEAHAQHKGREGMSEYVPHARHADRDSVAPYQPTTGTPGPRQSPSMSRASTATSREMPEPRHRPPPSSSHRRLRETPHAHAPTPQAHPASSNYRVVDSEGEYNVASLLEAPEHLYSPNVTNSPPNKSPKPSSGTYVRTEENSQRDSARRPTVKTFNRFGPADETSKNDRIGYRDPGSAVEGARPKSPQAGPAGGAERDPAAEAATTGGKRVRWADEVNGTLEKFSPVTHVRSAEDSFSDGSEQDGHGIFSSNEKDTSPPSATRVAGAQHGSWASRRPPRDIHHPEALSHGTISPRNTASGERSNSHTENDDVHSGTGPEDKKSRGAASGAVLYQRRSARQKRSDDSAHVPGARAAGSDPSMSASGRMHSAFEQDEWFGAPPSGGDLRFKETRQSSENYKKEENMNQVAQTMAKKNNIRFPSIFDKVFDDYARVQHPGGSNVDTLLVPEDLMCFITDIGLFPSMDTPTMAKIITEASVENKASKQEVGFLTRNDFYSCIFEFVLKMNPSSVQQGITDVASQICTHEYYSTSTPRESRQAGTAPASYNSPPQHHRPAPTLPSSQPHQGSHEDIFLAKDDGTHNSGSTTLGPASAEARRGNHNVAANANPRNLFLTSPPQPQRPRSPHVRGGHVGNGLPTPDSGASQSPRSSRQTTPNDFPSLPRPDDHRDMNLQSPQRKQKMKPSELVSPSPPINYRTMSPPRYEVRGQGLQSPHRRDPTSFPLENIQNRDSLPAPAHADGIVNLPYQKESGARPHSPVGGIGEDKEQFPLSFPYSPQRRMDAPMDNRGMTSTTHGSDRSYTGTGYHSPDHPVQDIRRQDLPSHSAPLSSEYPGDGAKALEPPPVGNLNTASDAMPDGVIFPIASFSDGVKSRGTSVLERAKKRRSRR